MVCRVHHITFLVRDLEAAVPRWESLLGVGIATREMLPERGVSTARFLLGDTWLVLVQPIRADSLPGRHLAEHGEGFFLLSLAVDTLAGESDRLGDSIYAGPARRGVDERLGPRALHSVQRTLPPSDHDADAPL